MNKIKHIVEIGNKYNKLTVIDVSPKNNNKKQYYICKCDCGNIKIVDKYSLINGKTKSCGCILIKHRCTNTPLYKIWKNIKTRCNNSNNLFYKNYGAKGINICTEWNDFSNFKQWSESNGYEPGLSIDRIDGTKGYNASNCRWISFSKQSKNRTSNLYFLYDSKIYNLYIYHLDPIY